jgi:hypothetical protein
LIALAWTLPLSMKAALTLLVSKASFERAVSELKPITAASLTVDFTFSIPAMAFSAASRSASLATSPVISTRRL